MDPTTTPSPTPTATTADPSTVTHLLDPGQFTAFVIAAGFIILLLAFLAIKAR